MRGGQTKPLSAFAAFEVSTAQNAEYTKVEYSEVTYSATLITKQHILNLYSCTKKLSMLYFWTIIVSNMDCPF